MNMTAPTTIPATLEVDSRKESKQATKLEIFGKQLVTSFSWLLRGVKIQPKRKTLRLCENLPLGDKRFVAVIQVEGERFLIGGAAGSVSLLTRLQETANFSDSLQNKLKEEAAR